MKMKRLLIWLLVFALCFALTACGEEVFICVGAAHIVGEGAMAELLAQRGYTVKRIVTE